MIYEESARSGCTKAMLALASIYERTNSSAAFKYYDEAGVTEPYALFKLGDFMEKGLTYEH